MKGSQDSKPYPLFNTHKDGRGKYGAKNGAQSNRGTQEMTEEEYNSFRKPNQGNAEETKKKRRRNGTVTNSLQDRSLAHGRLLSMA
jgi:hypothetical protein